MIRLITRWWPAMSSAAPIDLGRWITSWQLWLVLAPLTFFSLLSHQLDDLSLAQAAPSAAIGSLAGGVFLWGASVTVVRNRRNQPPTVTQALVVWLVAGVVTYLVAEATSRYAFAVADSPVHVVRDVTRYSLAVVLRTVLVVVGASALVNTRSELAQTQQALFAQHDELGKTQRYLAELRFRCSEFVKQSIEPRLHALMSEVSLLKATDQGADVNTGIADELEDFSSQQVRALSHQVVDLVDVPVAKSDECAMIAVAPSGLSLIHGWIRELPPVLPWVVFFLVNRIGYGTYDPLSLWGALGYAALCTLVWLILTFARLVGERKSGELNLVPRWIGIWVLIAVGFVSWFVGLGFENLGDSLRMAHLTLVGQSLLTLIGVWVLNHILIQRGSSQRQLADATSALENSVMLRDAAAEQLRYRLAGILHGPVQGRLALASMTIRQFVDSQNDDPGARAKVMTTVEEILTSIDQEIAHLASGAPSVRTFHEFITDMQQAWVGVLEIETRIGASVEVAMRQSAALEESVILVVKEAVMNARRHGRARLVFVSLELYDRAQLQISVLDDGVGADSQRGTGLGTRLYDRATSSWSLADVGFGGALFSALLDVPTASGRVQTLPELSKVG